MSLSFPINEDPRFRISTAAGGETTASVPFPFQKNGDIALIKFAVGGAEVPWIEGTHYTLTGAGNIGGGTATFVAPLVAGEKILRMGITELDRTTSITRTGKFSSAALDADLDRWILIAQELRRDVGRAWQVDLGQVAGTIHPGAAGQMLLYDAFGGVVPGANAGQIAGAEANAEAAANFAAAAHDSSILAAAFAEAPENQAIFPGVFSAKHHAKKAADSAIAAANAAAAAASNLIGAILGWTVQAIPLDADIMGWVRASDSAGRRFSFANLKTFLAGAFPRFDAVAALTATQRQQFASNVGMGEELIGYIRLATAGPDITFLANLWDYIELRFAGALIPTASGGSFTVRASKDAGATFISDATAYYYEAGYFGGGGSAAAPGLGSYHFLNTSGATAAFPVAVEGHITSFNKALVSIFDSHSGYDINAGSVIADRQVSTINLNIPANVAAFNGLRFAHNSGNLAIGSYIALYGLKG